MFDSGNVWDADSERTLDVLRFVALDSGLIDDPSEPLEGELFTTAYDRARRVYGAPLPRWEPAESGAREVTSQPHRGDDLVDACDLDGVATDALAGAREEVGALIDDATTDADTPTVVTALPATGKTTGTVKTATDRPLSYLAPRKSSSPSPSRKPSAGAPRPRSSPSFRRAGRRRRSKRRRVSRPRRRERPPPGPLGGDTRRGVRPRRGRRQVRRVLAELVEAGYLRRVGGGDGLANVYDSSATPGTGGVEPPS